MQNVVSPRTDDGAIEQEIQAKGLTAPRITPADIADNIASVHYFTAQDGKRGASEIGAAIAIYPELQLLTFCVIVMRNGFTVTGESACADPRNFDEELGREIAADNARQKIWALEGYLLRSRRSQPVTEGE